MLPKSWQFGKLALIRCLWECKLVLPLWKTGWHYHPKLSMHSSCGPEISFPEKSKSILTSKPQQYRIHMIIADISVKAPNGKQAKYFSM